MLHLRYGSWRDGNNPNRPAAKRTFSHITHRLAPAATSDQRLDAPLQTVERAVVWQHHGECGCMSSRSRNLPIYSIAAVLSGFIWQTSTRIQRPVGISRARSVRAGHHLYASGTSGCRHCPLAYIQAGSTHLNSLKRTAEGRLRYYRAHAATVAYLRC